MNDEKGEMTKLKMCTKWSKWKQDCFRSRFPKSGSSLLGLLCCAAIFKEENAPSEFRRSVTSSSHLCFYFYI